MKGVLKVASGAILVAGMLLGVAQSAVAQNFAFGHSTYDGHETLQLTTTSGVVVLNTNGNQGWWSPNFPNVVGNTNYVVGEVFPHTPFNNFFMFPLSSLAGTTVTGATLTVTQFETSRLTWRLGDASALANAGVLLPTDGTSEAIYNALGAGEFFGDFVLPPGNSDKQLSFTLNSSAVAVINQDVDAGDQYFAIGGTIPGLPGVPEPATWAVLSLGVGMIGFAARRRSTGIAVAA